MSDTEDTSPCIMTLSAAILQAYVRSNPLPPSALPSLLADIGEALRTMRDKLAGSQAALPQRHLPVSRTVTRDYIISLEDGQRYRSLKRHLKSRGMTAEEYRAKWGLDDDYPLVAPSLSALRASQARARAKPKAGATTAKRADGAAAS